MTLSGIRSKYIGDKAFYRMVLAIALPIMAQNAISSVVTLLDNVMVGQLGTECMSGVSVVNQLINVFYISIFGAMSGASIFGAQFFGKKDYEGQRQAFRFKLLVGLIITVVAAAVFLLFGNKLIGAYLTDDGTSDLALTASAAQQYLAIMLIGLLPNMLTQAYASSLRETGQTVIPMAGSFAAVFINLFLNWVLIFGNLGAPAMGVQGAAIATVISRYVEMLITVVWPHIRVKDYAFLLGAYNGFTIPRSVGLGILKKGTPLFINEFIYSIGQALVTQCYSTRGLSAVAAMNITMTIFSLFFFIFAALGNTIGIVVGQQLGAGELEKAVDTDRKMITFSVSLCVLVGILMYVLCPLFPKLYNTTDDVRALATNLLRVVAVFLPVHCYYNASYFTLRCGGKTVITLLFDGFYLCTISLGVAFVLSHFTTLPVLGIFIAVQGADVIKIVLGAVLLHKRVWVNNLVSASKEAA